MDLHDKLLDHAKRNTFNTSAEVEFDRLIGFVGVRRSGNHAIIGWIGGHLPGVTALYNNLNNTDERMIHKRDNTYFFDGEMINSNHRRREEIVDMEYFGKDHVIMSFEDKDCFFTYEKIEAEREAQVAGVPKSIVIFGVIRSFYNMAASRIQRYAERDNPGIALTPAVVDTWRDHAHCIFEEGDIVNFILYDKWIQDAEYRRSWEKEFGFPETDANLDLVSYFGRGSSFEHRDTTGAELREKVLERWKQISWEGYEYALQDEGIRELNQEIFGWALDEYGKLI